MIWLLFFEGLTMSKSAPPKGRPNHIGDLMALTLNAIGSHCKRFFEKDEKELSTL